MTANARHSKATPRWGSPANWCVMARIALGGDIELDPMSEPAFNVTVRAARIFTEADDGLKQPWVSPRLFLNPAGGLVVEAWQKLCAEYEAGNVRRAVWIGFSVEQLNLLADEKWHPDDFSKLTVRKRIDFTTVHPWRAVNVVEEPIGRWRRVLECGHEPKRDAKEKRGAVRCTECIGAPEPNGAPSHSNYVVGLGIAAERFEMAFRGMGRFHHGVLALHNDRAEAA